MAVRDSAAVLEKEPSRRRVLTRVGADSAAWKHLEAEVLGLRRPWNWDRERGRAIRASACRAAVALAREVHARRPDLALPRVSPSDRGAVALTWYANDDSMTVFIALASSPAAEYLWNGADFSYESGVIGRNELVERIAGL